VFAFPDDEYRTRGVPHDPLGCTAHEDMFEAGMAMSRDDDKIGSAIARDIGDYFKGCAHSDNHFFQELRFNRVFRQCIQFFLQGLDRETLAHRDVSQVYWIGKRLNGVKQRDLCFKLLREWHRVFERLLRDFGEINRYQDTLEFEDRRDESNSIAFPGYAAWSTCFCRCIQGLL
jgi:hypothetical protein